MPQSSEKSEQRVEGKIRYAGPALETGVMDVRDFAPAILALADLVQGASNTLNGPEIRASVLVRTRLRKGSVIADFDLVMTGAFQVVAFGASLHAVGATELARAIGIHASASFNLLRLIKWLRGRKPQQVTRQETGNIQIEVEGNNNTVIVVPPDVHALYENEAVRKAAYSVARPMERPGVDTLEFRERRKIAERIAQSDLPALRAAAQISSPKSKDAKVEKEVELSEEMTTVDLRQGVFNEDESFRFFDGENSFYARITDKEWWGEIHDRTNGFFEGDRLKVRIVSRQTVDEEGKLHKEREVVEVIHHEHMPKQINLFGDETEVA